jgi:uncharacterized protein YndB with AHSA1/START domain
MQQVSVEQSVWINAAPERVWQAITEKQQLEIWWSPMKWHISSQEVGGNVEFGEEGEYSTGRISVFDAPRVFQLDWESGFGFPALTTIYRLEAENGGTMLTLTESGYEALPDDVRQQRVDSSAEGYRQVLQDLKTYIEGQA